MPTWLDDIKRELKKIKPETLIDPGGEIGPLDHVAGEIDIDLKRLYYLARQWDKTATESLVAARYANNQEQQRYHVEKASEFHEKSKVIIDIFWISIKNSFDLWEKSSVGIRKGWKVVWSEQNNPHEQAALEILNRLFERNAVPCEQDNYPPLDPRKIN